jgi:hypothetical protein
MQAHTTRSGYELFIFPGAIEEPYLAAYVNLQLHCFIHFLFLNFLTEIDVKDARGTFLSLEDSWDWPTLLGDFAAQVVHCRKQLTCDPASLKISSVAGG